MTKSSRQKQIEINRMKKQIQFMRRRNESQKVLHNNFNQKVNVSTCDVKSIQEKHQNVKMEQKILNRIIDRMKKDQIWHKNALRIKDAQLSNCAKDNKQKSELLLAQDQNLHKLHSTLSQIKDLCTQNQYEREKKYQSYLQRIENLQEKQRFVQERQQRTQQLLSIESNDILYAKNQLGRQVLMVNKMCDNILQVKIFSLLKKYEDVQNAFHAIKTKTSISDPHFLANKFFSYDQLSQNLIKQIYTSELKLQDVSEKNKRLEAKYKEVAYMEIIGNNQSIPVKNLGNLFSQQKNKILTQAIQKQLLLNKIKQQIQRNFNRLGCQQLTDLDPVSMKFRGLCSKLKQEISRFDKKGEKIIDRNYTTVGFRVKKFLKQVSIQKQNIRRIQTQQMDESIETENKYISESRNMIKKSDSKISLNAKFVNKVGSRNLENN